MRNIFLILILFWTIPCLAQCEHTIKMKDGSEFCGNIISMSDSGYIEIKTMKGESKKINFNDIASCTRSDKLISPEGNKRFFVLSDIGFLIGTVDNEVKAPISFQTTFNMQMYKSIYTGIGAGLEFYQNTYIPLILDVIYKPYKDGFSVYLMGGYTIPLEKQINYNGYKYNCMPGYLLNPGISYTFPSDNKTYFTVGVGYRYQKMDIKNIDNQFYYYYNDYSIIRKLNRFVLRLGYSFY